MADAVTTTVLLSTPTRYAAVFTNISDGVGESGVTKVDISGLALSNGNAPKAVTVEEIHWNIQGFTSVRLLWDHSTDDLIVPMSGGGYVDWSGAGGKQDPRSAGGTGDVLLTTAGAVSGATYLITLVLRLEN